MSDQNAALADDLKALLDFEEALLCDDAERAVELGVYLMRRLRAGRCALACLADFLSIYAGIEGVDPRMQSIVRTAERLAKLS
jgi:hypothetical protein